MGLWVTLYTRVLNYALALNNVVIALMLNSKTLVLAVEE